MTDETLTITALQPEKGSREIWLHIFGTPASDDTERFCHAALLPTVVGSNCIRALSGNRHARHPGNWCPREEGARWLAAYAAVPGSGEYPRVR